MTPATCPLAASTNRASPPTMSLVRNAVFQGVIFAGGEEIDRNVDLGEIHRHPALRGLAGVLDVVFEMLRVYQQYIGPGRLRCRNPNTTDRRRPALRP